MRYGNVVHYAPVDHFGPARNYVPAVHLRYEPARDYHDVPLDGDGYRHHDRRRAEQIRLIEQARIYA